MDALYNIDTSPNGIYLQYSVPQPPFTGDITIEGGVFPVTTIKVDSGTSITGPTVTVTGGVSGFTFNGASSTITLVSPLTAKGDIYTHNSTVGTKLAVGTDGFVLSADSASATGLKWIAAGSSGADSLVNDLMLMGG